MDKEINILKKKINKNVISKLYPDVIKIKNISALCSLYEMKNNSKDWQFTEIQGPLFIISKENSSYKDILILNQNSKIDFKLEIKNLNLETDYKSNMIYLKDENKNIKCLGFLIEKEYKKFYKLLNNLNN